MNNQEKLLLAILPKPLPLLEYQPIFCYLQSKKYLKSVNILLKGKMLKKLYLESYIELSETIDVQEIIAKLLADFFTDCKRKAKQESKPNNKMESKEAREKAAKNLFENIKS